MSRPRSISVLVPTWQGSAYLERALEALAAQRVDVPWDFRAVDSGSTDGTLELLEAWRGRFAVPFAVQRIHPVEFDHGDTRNLLAAESTGELLVYLTQDAIPSSPEWLARLHANFADERVGAAYCRNVPRPDAELLTKVFSANDPGYVAGRREVRLPDDYDTLDPHARRLLYNFNDVASAVRRELWVRHPFPRTEFGEDLLMARALLEAGHTVVYDDAATVEHSHDYGPDEMRRRAEIDGKFNAEWLGRICVGSAQDADTLVARQLERDRAALERAGVAGDELEAELARAKALRHAAFHGLYAGGRSERRFAGTQLLEREHLHVLYVVHGFPPDTWAGTEVYTLELAKAVQRLGHRVTVLTRTPGDEDEQEFTLREDELQGLRVVRMVNHGKYASVRASYASKEPERVFREVLARERPDVVHFQHLLHFSAALPTITRELGVPSVITCNDYWGLCARVQLIRPDGVRCEENQGMGCFVCVKGLRPEKIAAARRWYPAVAPALWAARAAVTAAGIDLTEPVPNPGPPGSKLARKMQGMEAIRLRHDFAVGGYAAADLQVAPSRFLRGKYLDTGRFDAQRFVYSDYGMRTEGLAAVAKREGSGPLRLGFVGTLVWYKGVDVLIRAMGQLDAQRAVLHVHGDFRPDEDEHHAELAALAGDNVVFHGRFDNERLAEVYAELDVLVVPSVWFENSPITIHEAFLFRTPVVTSDIGGMAELVEDGVSGLHFRAGDPHDLARVLRGLVQAPKRVEELSRSFPEVKSIEANGREMEYRYRALACLRPLPDSAR